MTGTIHWLASYPKSGNTWMRILLTNYFRSGDEPAHINELDGGPIASARQVFDDNIGIEASDLTQDEIEQLRPAVYARLSEQRHIWLAERRERRCEMPLILKAHDAWTTTPDGTPLMAPTATAGAIYLIRNPLDVVPSFAHHSGWTIDETVTKMGATDTSFVSNSGALHNQLRQRLLTWSDHVRSWTDDPQIPTVTIRYEDMIADTAEALRQVISFVGHRPDDERIEQAVDHSRFDRLQAQEVESPFREKSGRAPTFFRKGIAGDWRGVLTPQHVERICADHHEVMAAFDYLPRP